MKFASLWQGARRSPDAASALSLPLDSGASDVRADAAEIEREVTNLFDELRNPALRYLISMGLPAADGEEVLQEVFLALFQHLRRGRPRANLRGWVFRTAHNLGLKRRKRNHTNPAPAMDLELLAQPADQSPNPEQLLSAQQRYARMRAVLSALPERDRCCLSLSAEGLRYRQIASVLGISLGAVSYSIQRALSRLREAER